MKRLGICCITALALTGLAAGPSLAEVGPYDVALVADEDGSLGDMQTLGMPNVYLQKVACAFYAKYPDQFDAIFVFTTYPLNFITNVQQGWPVKNLAKGIGRPLLNSAPQFCSYDSRLRQAVKMGDLNVLPNDPDATYTGIPWYALSGIELMAHEFGHHWLASVTFMKEDGVKHCLIRGYEPSGEAQPGECDGYQEMDFNQHWSYYYNSQSVMYGSFIEDLGGGQFEVSYNGPKFSQLDQYLMGLRLPEDVEPQFLVDMEDEIGSSSLPIQPGNTAAIEGTRIDFTVEDVIRSEGERVPALDECHWKGALIIVHPLGQIPTPAQRQKVADYGQRFEEFYDWATDGRGSFDMTIDGSGTGSPGCSGTITPQPDKDFPDRPDMAQPEMIPEAPPVPDEAGPALDVPTPQDLALDGETAAPAEVKESGGDGGILCVANTLLCHPYKNVVVRCSADGKGWDTEEDCGSDALCDGGMCRPRHDGTSSGSCTMSRRMVPPGALVLFLLAALSLGCRRWS